MQKLLFVDDEPLLLRVIERLLGHDFDITTAEGGEAGLEALAQLGPFSVVFTDMRMPGMSGLEFLKQAQAVSALPTYIMLTGSQDEEIASQAIREGQAFRLLNKPCKTDELRVAIEDGIRHFESKTRLNMSHEAGTF